MRETERKARIPCSAKIVCSNISSALFGYQPPLNHSPLSIIEFIVRPSNLKVVDVPLVEATDESLKGFGRILHSPDDALVANGAYK